MRSCIGAVRRNRDRLVFQVPYVLFQLPTGPESGYSMGINRDRLAGFGISGFLAAFPDPYLEGPKTAQLYDHPLDEGIFYFIDEKIDYTPDFLTVYSGLLI
jgi:hypothetical protein